MREPTLVGAMYLSAVLCGVMAGMALQTQLEDLKRLIQKIRRYYHESGSQISRKKVEGDRDKRR